MVYGYLGLGLRMVYGQYSLLRIRVYDCLRLGLGYTCMCVCVCLCTVNNTVWYGIVEFNVPLDTV